MGTGNTNKAVGGWQGVLKVGEYMIEIWKDIESYEGLYQVSNLGKIKSLYNKVKYLKQDKSKGYLRVTLYKNKKPKHVMVHRLVAQAFIPNPNKYPYINHKDECKQNNRIDNLEWCTHSYNINYGSRNEKSAQKHRKKILCLDTGVIYNSIREAGRINNIHENDIGKACLGKIKKAGGFRWQKI